MTGPDGAGPLVRRQRALLRAARFSWILFAVVVWNVVFDARVIQAGREYLTRQALHQAGLGPAVTIRQVMDPEVARAVTVATASGGVVAAAGLLAVWLAARRRRGVPLPPRPE